MPTILCFSLLTFLISAVSQPAGAQQTNKVPRIGYLMGTSASVGSARTEAFRHGLRELGYVEGKNIIVDWRGAGGSSGRLPELATELVRRKVDVIVSSGPTITRFLKEVTTSIPIVMAYYTDPVGDGLVASLARPGANITGLSVLSPELGGKRLEILKEVVPKLSRVAVLGTSTLPGNEQTLRETKLAAAAFGVKVQFVDVLSPKDIEAAFRRMVKERAEAVLAQGSSVLNAHQIQVAELAAKHRLPAMYYAAEFVEAGGLMFYGVDFPDLFRRAATYVDKILKGRKPADLPVEQPIKFEFIVNLKTAKQIGLTIPQWTLMKADKVIR